MASETSGADFGVKVFKFWANIINVVTFICALEDQSCKFFENDHIHMSSETVKFLTPSKSSFFDFTKYFDLSSYDLRHIPHPLNL
jgi:hypothetical protein